MVFYQYTTSVVSMETIINTLLKGAPTSAIIDLQLQGYPDIITLEDALAFIDQKRQTLYNPYQHSFMVIEPIFYDNLNQESAIHIAQKIAKGIYTYLNNDLFIINLVYCDKIEAIHPIIVLSDIEISLPESTTNTLPPDALWEILSTAVPDFHLKEITNDSLYIFNGSKDNNLAYDGVIHLKCHIEN